MKLPINPACFTLEVLEQLSLYHIPKWEWNKTNTNLFKSITNNIAPFVSITWHQKEPLGCVVYSHCPTNDSYNICIHSCCLPCNYVTKPFGTLQRVIKSQRVYIYHLDSEKVDTFSLRIAKVANFSDNFNFKFSGLMKRYTKFRPYQCAVFKKEMFLLCPYDEMYSHFKLLLETFSYFVR